MTHRNWRYTTGTVLGLTLAIGCGGGSSSQPDDGATSSIEIRLSTRTSSGNEYRLTPASFTVQSHDAAVPALHVRESGESGSLRVKVTSGTNDVSIDDGWVLNRVVAGGQLEPQVATLTSSPVQSVYVYEFQTTPVTFNFHLGATAIDIGFNVEEGDVPPGFDGAITTYWNGVSNSFAVQLAHGGGACCYASVAEARAAYPSLNLYVPTP